MTVQLVKVFGGPYGKDVKAGPIFDEDGEFFLLALRDVSLGELDADDAFVYPDFSRPKVGECETKAAKFWYGWIDFSQ